MPSPAEIDDFRSAMDDVKALMVAALVEEWATSIQPDPAGSADQLRQFVLDLVAEYGQVAAATAIDFYDSVRPPGSPAFRVQPSVRSDIVGTGTLNWMADPLIGEDFEKALERAAAEIQKAAYQAAIETIGEATDEDPIGNVKYARWPRNPKPCAWCVLRASRGAVYWSEQAAERGDHVKCGCDITPIFPGERLPYLLKPYKAAYAAGAQEADGPGRKALLSGMRRANGTR